MSNEVYDMIDRLIDITFLKLRWKLLADTLPRVCEHCNCAPCHPLCSKQLKGEP